MKRSRFISLMLAGLLGFTSISFPTEVLGSELDIEAVEAVEVSDEEEALDYAYEDVTRAAESEDTVEVSTEDEAVDKDEYAVSFTLDRDEISLATGDKDTIKAEFSDESVDKTTLTWMTEDPTVASVDQSGNVTAVGPGEADIWAKAPNGTESQNRCKVTVYDQIKSIKLDPSSKTVNTGDEFVLRADVGAYTVTESTIITTTGSTVEVGPAISFQAEDENLTITPYGEGKVLVKAASSIGDNTSVKSSVIVRSTDGSEKEARCSVTINAKDDRVPLKTLGLNATSITMCGGKAFRIYPVYTPSNATVDKSSITYDYADEKSKDYITLDPVATGVWITAKQLPSGVSKATAKVKVSAADHTGARKEAICSVTVTNKQVMVSKINLSHKKISMGSNSHATLSATVVPAWADVTEVEWGQPSVPGIVSVFEYVGGTVEITALKPGTTKLTVSAKDGSNKSATCTITVGDPVESVSVKNKAKLDGSMLTVGKTITLKADAAATSGKPANPQVTWKSSDKSVAIVDKNGKVTAKTPGTVTITARSEEDGEGNYKTDSVTFKVQIPIKKIAVNGKSSISVYQGKIGTIQPVITPVDATNTQINWECSDKEAVTFIQPVTQGDEKLSFIAGKPGKFKITGQALDGSKKKVTVTVNVLGRMFEDDVKLNIKRIPKGLVVDGNNTNNVVVNGLNASKKQSLTLTPVLTAKAYNKNVTFTSINPKVVEVDKKGKIKAVGEGSSRITMTTEDGNYTAICMVTTIKK